MSEPPRLPLTPEEDRDLLEPLQNIAFEMCESFGDDDFDLAVLRLAHPWRALYSISRLDAEVQNGGFHQFFWNSDGKLNTVVAQGLRFLEAVSFAEIFKRAILCAEEFKVVEAKHRSNNSWEKFTAGYKTIPWNDLDQAYCSESPTLLQYAARYVREHPADFDVEPG